MENVGSNVGNENTVDSKDMEVQEVSGEESDSDESSSDEEANDQAKLEKIRELQKQVRVNDPNS